LGTLPRCRRPSPEPTLAVYVDDAFRSGAWGRWTGGGHLQGDSPKELHAFAASIGMQRAWFQSRPGRPDRDHYDLTRDKREEALRAGAIAEPTKDGILRRRALRQRAHHA
jgi:hypothetical protein